MSALKISLPHRSSRQETPTEHSNRKLSSHLSPPLFLWSYAGQALWLSSLHWAPGLGEGTELTYGLLCIVGSAFSSSTTLALLLLLLQKTVLEKCRFLSVHTKIINPLTPDSPHRKKNKSMHRLSCCDQESALTTFNNNVSNTCKW